MSDKLKHLAIGLVCFPLAVGCAADVDEREPGEGERPEVAPLLHLTFDADLSWEEIEARWQAAVDDLALWEQRTPGGLGDQAQAFAFFPPLDRWVMAVTTLTGTGQNDGTDDRVRFTFWYEGDGSRSVSLDLDNPGNDRERGQVDRYLFTVLGRPSSVRFTRARIGLQGTDGWGLDYFSAETQGPYGPYNELYTGAPRAISSRGTSWTTPPPPGGTTPTPRCVLVS